MQGMSMQCRAVPIQNGAVKTDFSNSSDYSTQLHAASKEQCHEDFAVLGQFCAKIITLKF